MPRITKNASAATPAVDTKQQTRFPAWKFTSAGASRTVVFPRHVDAVVFIARIAIRSEVAGVHPTILLSRARAEVTLSGAPLGGAALTVMETVDVLCPYGDKRQPKRPRVGILKTQKKK